jgi:hypothetical protein
MNDKGGGSNKIARNGEERKGKGKKRRRRRRRRRAATGEAGSHLISRW